MLQWIGRDLSGSEMYPPFLEGDEQGRKHWRNAAYGCSVVWVFVFRDWGKGHSQFVSLQNYALLATKVCFLQIILSRIPYTNCCCSVPKPIAKSSSAVMSTC